MSSSGAVCCCPRALVHSSSCFTARYSPSGTHLHVSVGLNRHLGQFCKRMRSISRLQRRGRCWYVLGAAPSKVLV
jgi:hypothetical protein